MGNPVGAVKAANSKVFGLGKSMLSKTVDTTKSYGSLFARNPLTAVGQGTKGLLKTSVDVTKMTLMSPATVTQALSRKRAEIWCRISFAAYQHVSDVVGDVTPEEPEVALEAEVTWRVRPNEHAALSLELFRKSNFAVEIQSCKEETLGCVMWCWDELFECGQHGRVLDDWFPCSEGNFDEQGRPVDGGREIHVKVELLTKAIDGSEALPLFDPLDDLHRLYADFYAALNPGMALMPPPAVDWLLCELRMKCGVCESWHNLLRLAPGLNLGACAVAVERQEAMEMREGRLLTVLGYIRQCHESRDSGLPAPDASCSAVIFPVALGLRQALRFIQGQVRNGLLMFPYKLGSGPEGDEEYHEPVELRLLCQIDEAVMQQLTAQEQRDTKLASHLTAVHPAAHLTTHEVVAEGLCRFIKLFYSYHLQTSLAKDRASGKTKQAALGWGLPEGEVMGKHVKTVVKRATDMVQRLQTHFGQVLPPAALQRALTDLVSMVTVDVLSLISAYHLRGQGCRAFQEGSEEAMLLKLHLRANSLRQIVAQVMPQVQSDGLATATAPLLSAWIEKTHDNIVRWIKRATSVDTWQPAAGPELGGPSSSLIDVFSAAEHAVNTFLGVRMAAQVSLRLKFLELIQNVCTHYLGVLKEHAQEEHASNAARERLLKGAHQSSGGAGVHLGVMSFQALQRLPFMDGLLPARADDTHSQARHQDHDDKDDSSTVSGGSHTWEDKGEQYLEKFESLAESAVSVSAWKKGLSSLGRKSLNATRTMTRASIQVATLGQVKVMQDNGDASSDSVHRAPSSHAGQDSSSHGSASSKGAAAPRAALTPADFFDGKPLLSKSSCTRLSNIISVKLQLDTLVGILEADDDFAGRSNLHAGAGGDAGSMQELAIPSEWIQSEMYENKTTEVYNHVRTCSEGAMDVELRPLLQWLGATIAAALTEEGGCAEQANKNAFRVCVCVRVYVCVTHVCCKRACAFDQPRIAHVTPLACQKFSLQRHGPWAMRGGGPQAGVKRASAFASRVESRASCQSIENVLMVNKTQTASLPLETDARAIAHGMADGVSSGAGNGHDSVAASCALHAPHFAPHIAPVFCMSTGPVRWGHPSTRGTAGGPWAGLEVGTARWP